VGLHQRYATILGNKTLTLAAPIKDELREELRKKFAKMMSALFKQKGANFDINIIASDEAQDFINTHTSVLDSSFQKVEMSDLMRQRLTRSNYIFSGMKTFHELNEASPSLLDENGNKKTFERFLNDVRKIDETYNSNYLRAEYNFVQASAEMAAKWEKFMEDGDHYYLQYRTQHDDKVRPEHASLDRVTLPSSDSFWESYYPPNGWNCRCTVVQVLKRKYEPTPHDEAMSLGEEALQTDKKGIFRFNSGKEQKTFPDYNPYTIKRCRDCDIAKGKLNLGFVPENELCAACKLVHKCQDLKGCVPDEIYGNRLLISKQADQSEIVPNTRAARALVSSFPDMTMQIRKDVVGFQVKNPEYLINGMIADRKGILSPNGVASGFNKAIKQGCSAVVIDLDMHPENFKELQTIKMASAINNRHMDFENGTIQECYVVFNGKAVRITANHFVSDTKQTKENIKIELDKIKGDRTPP
jgi:SPP1 gp7 family putative phage head morphogenesis protein